MAISIVRSVSERGLKMIPGAIPEWNLSLGALH